MRRTLHGLRLLITGASGGIGRCLAEQSAQAGAKVGLVARSEDRLRALAESLTASGGEAVPLPGDVTHPEDRQRVLDGMVQRFGGLDVLINNAGVGSFAHFVDSSEDVLRRVMELNFFAPAELIRLAVPLLARGRQPAIVNVSSMCGRRGLPAWPEYSASKFALCGLTEALRGEMARFNVDVLLVVPGLTRSDLGRNLLRHTGRMELDFSTGMSPEQTAAGILKALKRNRTETVLGRDARWMLRAQRWFPGLVDRLLARYVRRLYVSA